MQLRRWCLLAPALSYGLARLPQLGMLTTARHAYHSSAHLPQLRLQNTTARAAIPPLFSSHFVIRPSHSTHLTCYHPRCGKLFTAIFIDIVLVAWHHIVQLPTVCHLESCANNLTKHVDLFAASYSRLSLRPASFSPPSSSTSYSSRPTDAIHAAGILIDIVLIASQASQSSVPSVLRPARDWTMAASPRSQRTAVP